jgi:hypothetical protein
MVNNNIIINDSRILSDFKKITFSKYKKLDALNELKKNIKNSKTEESCYWCAELICAGHFKDIWDIIIIFYSKHIHIANPKLIIYINMKLILFKTIINSDYDILDLRNNDIIRNLFFEIICLIILTKKQHNISRIKINQSEYEININTNTNIKTTNMENIQSIYISGDPICLMLPFNEFAYSISNDIKNNISACYWLEWILGLLKQCKKHNKKYTCHPRKYILDSIKSKNIIWIFWDIIINESNKRDKITQKCISNTLDVFCLKFNNTIVPKYINLIYFVISLLTQDVCYNTNIVSDSNKTYISENLLNINSIYKQIKQQEICSDIIPIVSNSTKNTLSSKNKMEILNNYEFI